MREQSSLAIEQIVVACFFVAARARRTSSEHADIHIFLLDASKSNDGQKDFGGARSLVADV